MTYYLIVSRLNGLVLDVQYGTKDVHPGSLVQMWKKKEKDNQWWYDDPATGTIRSKINGFCLDIEGNGELRVMPYQPGDHNQQWERDVQSGYIRNRANHNRVLDILQMNREKGAKVGAWDANGGANQLWNFEAGAPLAHAVHVRKEFHIVSELNGKVLDVKAGNQSPGTPVIMWSKNSPVSKNQLWYADEHGYIRSVLTDFALDAESGKNVHLQPFNGGPTQQWVVDGNSIKNKSNGEVLDIVRGHENDGAELCSFKHHGNKNQQWRIEQV